MKEREELMEDRVAFQMQGERKKIRQTGLRESTKIMQDDTLTFVAFPLEKQHKPFKNKESLRT